MSSATARIVKCILVILVLNLAVMAGLARGLWGAELRTAVLTSAASLDRVGPEGQAAWQLAQQLTEATLLLVSEDGTVADQDGEAAALSDFAVIWHHQGDTAAQNGPVYQGRCVESLRQYVEQGGGLFLSGAAPALLHTMGLEPVRLRTGGGGTDSYQVKLADALRDHPVFAGVTFEGIFQGKTYISLTSGGWPAFADFYGTGGPTRGMVLARANSGDENPLVEYAAGQGRVIALGWRAANYALSGNAYRKNLEVLTGNILHYLADKERWQPVVLAPAAVAAAATPCVTEQQWQALQLAVTDLGDTFPDRYPDSAEFLQRLEALRQMQRAIVGADDAGTAARKGRTYNGDELQQLDAIARKFEQLKRDALLANPLIDFDRLLLIRRSASNLALPANWESNSSLPTTGIDNQLVVLSPIRPDGARTTLFQPEEGRFVGDVDLHFDGERLLFSMPGSNGRWQVFELNVDGTGLRELPLIHELDVDNYDACYLPDGRILFTSTAPFVGVPCVYGASHVTNSYLLEHDGSIRQVTVDQEHNWCPTVLNNGRVLYLRWEYTDLPHSNSRILFHMNPDGTGQMEYYGSNSFFANSFFYARPVPDHPTKVVGVATGHHGVSRAGRLLILDPALGRQEAEGVVQEIPGRGIRVEPIIKDNLVDGVWPQFLHPYPLSQKYFLVSARLSPESLWGIYLVDVFDNMLLVCEQPGYAMLEPIPLRRTARPPIIADKVDRDSREALVYMNDIYTGGGLQGIPRGAVKRLRLVSYQFSYRGMGGLLGTIGMDGPWDVRRVLGTVPVEADGSALFRVPAYTPIAVQPLDEQGQSLQVMRSWFTAMPGEVVSCVGCHEQQNTVTINRKTLAALSEPAEITPWRGPTRGFSFQREVQPVLNKYCVGCHDGRTLDNGQVVADLRGQKIIDDWSSQIAGHVDVSIGGKFSDSYVELHRFVRRPGIESNIRLLAPMEFHASTTELVQILRAGHYGVQLDEEAWDRLVTWIDLNAPYHGTWSEIVGEATVRDLNRRALTMRQRYTGMTDDPEVIPATDTFDSAPVVPQPKAEAEQPPLQIAAWPFDADEARRQQTADGVWEQTVDLGNGVRLELLRIPAGQFVMGDAQGQLKQRPQSVVTIDKPFWIGRCEVTNQQYAAYDARHDSGVEPMHGYQFGIHGYSVNELNQPVVRVSWDEANGFCRWLSERTGQRFQLPTEAQWEYACRAGTDSQFWYGDASVDFSRFANLGDARLSEFALDTYVQVRLVADPNQYDDWVPKDERFNDGGFVTVQGGAYEPNPWGVCDMHGNAWEWTRSLLRPYPYSDNDGRNEPSSAGRRVVRGGSWYDRPSRCSSAFRLDYEPFQQVFNVGFRVVMEEL